MIYILYTEILEGIQPLTPTYVLSGLSLLMIAIGSMYNFLLSPDPKIFSNYEEALHIELTEYFEQLNSKNKDRFQMQVSKNDMNWIEIHIPKDK